MIEPERASPVGFARRGSCIDGNHRPALPGCKAMLRLPQLRRRVRLPAPAPPQNPPTSRWCVRRDPTSARPSVVDRPADDDECARLEVDCNRGRHNIG